MAVQLYEAIVIDGAPDRNLPGHIQVKIPDLYRDNIVPCLVPPMFPNWTGGGWQSLPSEVNPDGGNVRVIVAHIGRGSFRWLGTSQVFQLIADGQSKGRAGARSGGGKNFVYIDDDAFVVETESGAKFRVKADGTVEIIGTTINMFGGAVPPTHAYLLSTAYLTDWTARIIAMDAFMLTVSTATTAPQIAAAAVTFIASQPTGVFAAKHTASLSTGAPYLSTRIKGD